MGANDKQVGGEHYKKDIQHWDWAADMPYLEGRATAYLDRHQDKNGLEDVKKAVHFIEKIMEKRYGVTLKWEVVEERDPYNEMAEDHAKRAMLEKSKAERIEMEKAQARARSMQNPYANIDLENMQSED